MNQADYDKARTRIAIEQLIAMKREAPEPAPLTEQAHDELAAMLDGFFGAVFGSNASPKRTMGDFMTQWAESDLHFE